MKRTRGRCGMVMCELVHWLDVAARGRANSRSHHILTRRSTVSSSSFRHLFSLTHHHLCLTDRCSSRVALVVAGDNSRVVA